MAVAQTPLKLPGMSPEGPVSAAHRSRRAPGRHRLPPSGSAPWGPVDPWQHRKMLSFQHETLGFSHELIVISPADLFKLRFIFPTRVNTTSKLEVTSQLCYCKHEPHPVSKLLHGISRWFETELVAVAFCKDFMDVLIDSFI